MGAVEGFLFFPVPGGSRRRISCRSDPGSRLMPVLSCSMVKSGMREPVACHLSKFQGIAFAEEWLTGSCLLLLVTVLFPQTDKT